MAKRRLPGAISRFAPSPTGLLHLGHAYSALSAYALAQGDKGRFILRIEDIDPTRCRPEFEAAIYEDLGWLELHWEGDVRRQSDHLDDHEAALKTLQRKGLVYPCFCSRNEIKAEIERSGRAPHGPNGPVYPGICRKLSDEQAQQRIEAGDPYALRLDMARAAAIIGPISWCDRAHGKFKARPETFGDVVLARKDTPTSYHLAVTVDDHLQGVSVVCRGADLLEATHIHRLLQALLGYDTPQYQHHRLLTDDAGRRLAKRQDSLSIRALREHGYTPEEVRAMTGFDG